MGRLSSVKIGVSLVLAVTALTQTGCAAAFRDMKPKVLIDSDPQGGQAKVGKGTLVTTPGEAAVDRNGTTPVTVTKAGYQDGHASVPKHMNGGWLAVDIATCIFPVALCIPVVVDAITGAWFDVDERVTVKLQPGAGSAPASTTPPTTPPPVLTGTPATPPPATGPSPQMTESERKATARAAFLEGTRLQEKNPAEALARFQTAQKLYDAPTHQLHIAQTQAATGRLVEAAETYETLTRRALPAGSPEVFHEAQESGKKELQALRPRIPSLRVQLQPPAASLSGLTVQINGQTMPNELVGIARPINPGTYRVTATASGYKPASTEVQLGESASKSAELTLSK